MTTDDLIKIAPLIKNFQAYTAFLALLDYREEKCVAKLSGEPSPEKLLRLSGEFNLIQQLKKAREDWFAFEKEKMNGV